MESWYDKGQRGEKLGKEILEKIGFTQFKGELKYYEKRASSWDVLVTRLGQKYAINIKFGNNFVITPNNALRLFKFCQMNDFKPAFLLIINPRRYFFYSLDNQIPLTIDKKNEKLELFV